MKLRTLLIPAFAFLLSGCSVYMASQQPDKKNVELFKFGTHRVQIMAEFGLPVASDTRADGTLCEVYSFNQGYAKGTRVSRVVAHGVADVLTFGLWEVIGTPAETAFNGDKVSYQVCYDQNKKVSEVIPLTEYKGD